MKTPDRIPNDVRSAETRRKVYEAAVSCLNHYGYSGTTMSKIASEAGVTRGALQHVYGDRRVDLMTAVAADLYEEYEGFYNPIIANADGPETLLSEIWNLNQRLYKTPETTALIELWLAMRGDEELRSSLRPFFENRDEQLSQRWMKEFADSSLSASQIQMIRYTQRALLRGLAIERLLHPDDDVLDSVIDHANRTTSELLRR